MCPQQRGCWGCIGARSRGNWPSGPGRNAGKTSEVSPGARASTSDRKLSQEILEMSPDCERYARMYDKVRSRGCFVLQPGHVVVLDVVPFDVGQVEHVDGRQPLAGILEAQFQVHRRVG